MFDNPKTYDKNGTQILCEVCHKRLIPGYVAGLFYCSDACRKAAKEYRELEKLLNCTK